jgi:hypothetical protein
LADDGSIVGLVHRLSGSRFVFHRDRTWRYVGYCSVSNGHEWLFGQVLDDSCSIFGCMVSRTEAPSPSTRWVTAGPTRV